jgi:hypothetical protein
VEQCCIRTTLPFILDCLPFVGYTANPVDNVKTPRHNGYIETKQPGENEMTIEEKVAVVVMTIIASSLIIPGVGAFILHLM